MKLRSGKVLLPPVISRELDSSLIALKTLLADDQEFVKELIQLISCAPSISANATISTRIREAFPNVELSEGLGDLLAASGSLLRLLTGYGHIYKENHIQPIYHDIIQQKMLEAFDIDISLSGADD